MRCFKNLGAVFFILGFQCSLLCAGALAALAQTPVGSPVQDPSAVGVKASAEGSARASSGLPVAGGAAVVAPPEKVKPVTLTRFERPPVIDGKLDDEVWKRAAVLTNFYQIRPGDNITPAAQT